MNHEIGQLDIPDRELRMTSTQPRVSYSREIGEAVITHTIFGKAKVRIIRKHDKLHRVLWLSGMLVLAVIAWQVWLALQPTQGAASLPDESAQMQSGSPVVHAESMVSPSVPLAVSAAPIEVIKPMITPQSVPQAAATVMSARPVAPQTRPVAQQPLVAAKPQATPPVINKYPADKPLVPKPPSPVQPATPAVAKPHVAQSAASSPTAAAPLAAPLVKETVPAKSPVVDKQPAEPVNMQGK